MKQNSISILYRITYSDTDQMGFMHHSNYLRYYETARWELFRNIGLPYTEIEDEGYIFPVVNVTIKYLKPALYDQEINIVSSISSLRGASLIFENSAFNKKGIRINEAKITVACVKKSTGKACHFPESLTRKLSEIISKHETDGESKNWNNYLRQV